MTDSHDGHVSLDLAAKDNTPIPNPEPPQAVRSLQTLRFADAVPEVALNRLDHPPDRRRIKPFQVAPRTPRNSGSSASDTKLPLYLVRRVHPTRIAVGEPFPDGSCLMLSQLLVLVGSGQ